MMLIALFAILIAITSLLLGYRYALRFYRLWQANLSRIALTSLAFIVSTMAIADVPLQTVFSEQKFTPTHYFQTGQAACEYLSRRLGVPGGPALYANPIYVAAQNGCQFVQSQGGQPVTYQNWVLSSAICPQGYSVLGGTCTCTDATLCPKNPPSCEADGNPILRGYGIKRQTEIDYVGINNSLRFERIYNSVQSASFPRLWSGDISFGVGGNWLHTYNRVIDVVSNSSLTSALVYRPNGGMFVFQHSGNNWVADADVKDTLTQQTDSNGNVTGWIYYNAISDETETYNNKGLLLTIRNRNGVTQTLIYSTASTPRATAPLPNLLMQVVDSFGRQLNFVYDSAGRLSTMTDPTGGIYTYAYNNFSQLASVQYPDTKTRGYLYNESAYAPGMPSGTLTGITDENGQRFATFTYANGKASSTYHGANIEKYSLSYSANQTTVTDPLNSARTYSFQTIQGVVRGMAQSQPGGAGCGPSSNAVTYDTNGNIASKTDFNNNVTNYVYDLNRNLETSRTEAFGTPLARTITTQWHAVYRLPTLITEPGKTTAFTYDASGNLLSKTITDTALNKSRTWTYTYNSLGQVLTANGPRIDVNDITTYTYYSSASSAAGSVHAIGDLATVTNALGHVTSITHYDLNGRPLTIVDPNNVITTLTYTPRGWLKSRTVNNAQTTTYDYDGVGQLTQITLPDNSALKYTYDTAHRLTDIEDGYVSNGVLTLSGNKIHYTLDAMGNRLKEDTQDPGNAIVKTRARVFDALNRLQKDIGGTSPSTQMTQYGYDNNGNLTTITDPLNHITTNGYDALNRLITVTDPANGVSSTTYDALDQVTQVKDPRLVTTNYTVDGLGNVTLTQSPDSGNTHTVYDAAGNVIQKTDARGVVSNYSYDALNRLTTITYPANASENVAFGYDDTVTTYYRKGRLSYIVANNNSQALSYAYDAYGNIVMQNDLSPATWALNFYEYDNANRLSRIKYPNGRIVIYTRNALGQIVQVHTQDNASAALQTVISNATYEPFGPLKSVTFANGVTTAIQHDADYRVARITTTATPGWDDIYHYDAAGNLTSLADQLGNTNTTYGYDALDRVIAENNPIQIAHQYDAGGNRTLYDLGNGWISMSQTYAANSNRASAIAGAPLTSDAAGNLTTSFSKTMTYNNANRLSQSTASNIATTYQYTGLGWRNLKTSGAQRTHYAYLPDGKTLAQMQLNADGNYNQGVDYIWLDDMPIAQIKTTYAANSTPSTRRLTYIHGDHLNTPRLMTDATKKVVWNWWSDAYGVFAPSENPDGDSVSDKLDLRFPGQIADAESGLYYNLNRYYDSVAGRYTQSDPIGLAGGLNTYAYVGGNPVNYIDPLGLMGNGASGRSPPNTHGLPASGHKGSGVAAQCPAEINCETAFNICINNSIYASLASGAVATSGCVVGAIYFTGASMTLSCGVVGEATGMATELSIAKACSSAYQSCKAREKVQL